MSLGGKLEGEIEINAPADTFHEFYLCRPYDIANCCPVLQSVDLHEGKWEEKGSVATWTYFLGGKTANIKVIAEEIDNKNRSASYKTLEGSPTELYKSFKVIRQVTPKEGGSLVHWTFEYEKQNENVPDPKALLQLVLNCCKDVDAHLAQQHT